MNPRRLADGNAVSYPRPRHSPLGHAAAGLVWWLVWAAWWFAAGVFVAKDWMTCPF